jgi:dephospho-CoA kinase
MSALKVGLTGGLASGKSTVARWLGDAGFTVVDADAIVADLYRPGEPGAEVARELFGDGVLDEHGGVEHGALAARVFGDPEARRRLESRVHPLVGERFAELAEAAQDVAVLEATLLAEAGFAPRFDLVVTVEADPELRLARAVERGMSPDEARARLAAQGSGDARRAAAHRVLRNDGSPADLRRQVDDLVAELRRRAARAGGGASAGW